MGDIPTTPYHQDGSCPKASVSSESLLQYDFSGSDVEYGYDYGDVMRRDQGSVAGGEHRGLVARPASPTNYEYLRPPQDTRRRQRSHHTQPIRVLSDTSSRRRASRPLDQLQAIECTITPNPQFLKRQAAQRPLERRYSLERIIDPTDDPALAPPDYRRARPRGTIGEPIREIVRVPNRGKSGEPEVELLVTRLRSYESLEPAPVRRRGKKARPEVTPPAKSIEKPIAAPRKLPREAPKDTQHEKPSVVANETAIKAAHDHVVGAPAATLLPPRLHAPPASTPAPQPAVVPGASSRSATVPAASPRPPPRTHAPAAVAAAPQSAVVASPNPSSAAVPQFALLPPPRTHAPAAVAPASPPAAVASPKTPAKQVPAASARPPRLQSVIEVPSLAPLATVAASKKRAKSTPQVVSDIPRPPRLQSVTDVPAATPQQTVERRRAETVPLGTASPRGLAAGWGLNASTVSLDSDASSMITHPLVRGAAAVDLDTHGRRVTIVTPSSSVVNAATPSRGEGMARPRAVTVPVEGILRSSTPKTPKTPVQANAKLTTFDALNQYVFPSPPTNALTPGDARRRSRPSVVTVASPTATPKPRSRPHSAAESDTGARGALVGLYESAQDSMSQDAEDAVKASRPSMDATTGLVGTVVRQLQASPNPAPHLHSMPKTNSSLSQPEDLFPTRSVYSIPNAMMRFANINGTSFRRLSSARSKTSVLHRTLELPKSRWAYIAHFASQYRKAVPANASAYSLMPDADISSLDMNIPSTPHTHVGLLDSDPEGSDVSMEDSIVDKVFDENGDVLHAPTESFLWNSVDRSPHTPGGLLEDSVSIPDLVSIGTVDIDAPDSIRLPPMSSDYQSRGQRVSVTAADDSVRSKPIDDSDDRNKAVRRSHNHSKDTSGDTSFQPFPVRAQGQPPAIYRPPPPMPGIGAQVTAVAQQRQNMPRVHKATYAQPATQHVPPLQRATAAARENTPSASQPLSEQFGQPSAAEASTFTFVPSHGPPLPQPKYHGTPDPVPEFSEAYWEKKFNMRLRDFPYVQSPVETSLPIRDAKQGRRRQKA